MIKGTIAFLGFIGIVSGAAADADGRTWILPLEVAAENTSVTYVVDSTWHTVRGVVAAPSGKIWLNKETDPLSVRAELSFPVSSFDSDNNSRDRKMLRVMHADRFPAVTFRASAGLGKECHPALIPVSGSCKTGLRGLLTISGTSKEIELPLEIANRGDAYEIRGDMPLKWAEFGVEDPSILIAKLAAEVTVSFKIQVKSK